MLLCNRNLTVEIYILDGEQLHNFFTQYFSINCLIDCKVITTVKAQKSIKNIVRIVHLPSVVQP